MIKRLLSLTARPQYPIGLILDFGPFNDPGTIVERKWDKYHKQYIYLVENGWGWITESKITKIISENGDLGAI